MLPLGAFVVNNGTKPILVLLKTRAKTRASKREHHHHCTPKLARLTSFYYAWVGNVAPLLHGEPKKIGKITLQNINTKF